jgi:hypothetical protein
MGLLEVCLDPATVIFAVDPGKVMNRVLVSNGAGPLEEQVSLSVVWSGIAALEKMLATHAGDRVIAVEATGSLRRAWAAELERRHPGAIRLFAARTQLGSGRFNSDDRDCAAMTDVPRPTRCGPSVAGGSRRSRSCVGLFAIGVVWSRTARRPSSGSMISSAAPRALGCLHPTVTPPC